MTLSLNRRSGNSNGQIHWLTVPVNSKGAFDLPINKIAIADSAWARKHWTSLKHAYAKAPFFARYAPLLEDLYQQAGALALLTEINELLLCALCRELEIPTPFVRSDVIPRAADNPTGRLVEICLAREAAAYVSGPAAKGYIETGRFKAAGIDLLYANYAGYPVYDQAMTPFDHGVSFLDVLLRCGPEARTHLKSLRDRASFLDPA